MQSPVLVQHASDGSLFQGQGLTASSFTIRVPNRALAGNCLIIIADFSDNGKTITSITDDSPGGSNTWPANSLDATGSTTMRSQIFVLPNCKGGSQQYTVNFSAVEGNCHFTFLEYAFTPASGAVGVTAVSTTAAAPSVQTAAISPAAGSLVLYYVAQNGGQIGESGATQVSSYVPAAGWDLEAADYGSGNTADPPVCAQVFALAARVAPGGSVTPGITTTGTNTWNAMAIEVKAGSSGQLPPAGIRIRRAQYFTNTNLTPNRAWKQPFPTAGNLVVVTEVQGDIQQAITDNLGNAWTMDTQGVQNSQSSAHHVSGARASRQLEISFPIFNGTGLNTTITCYDVTGADPSAAVMVQDVIVGGSVLAGVATITDSPLITPTYPNGLIIVCVGIGQGPVPTLTSPATAIPTMITYPGETDLDTFNNADMYGVNNYGFDRSAQHWNWTRSNTTNTENLAGTAQEFKAGASGQASVYLRPGAANPNDVILNDATKFAFVAFAGSGGGSAGGSAVVAAAIPLTVILKSVPSAFNVGADDVILDNPYAKSSSSTFTYTGSGGGTGAGSATIQVLFAVAGAGGGSSAGSAALQAKFAVAGAGGGTAGGSATVVAKFAVAGAGGGSSAGAATLQAIFVVTGAGGATGGGAVYAFELIPTIVYLRTGAQRPNDVLLRDPSKLLAVTYPYAGVGGGSSSGSAVLQSTSVLTASGGGTGSGHAPVQVVFVVAGAGGGSAAGSAVDKVKFVIAGAGGGSSAGSASVVAKFAVSGAGGGSSAGAATLQAIFVIVGAGGGSVGGTAGAVEHVALNVYLRAVTGATNDVTLRDPTKAISLFAYSGAGGGAGSGQALLAAIMNVIASGGGAAAGSAPRKVAFAVSGAGGGVASGAASLHAKFVLAGSGGGSAGGSAARQVKFVLAGSGGGTAGGSASRLVSFALSGSGGGSGAGSAARHVKFVLAGSGGSTGSGHGGSQFIPGINTYTYAGAGGGRGSGFALILPFVGPRTLTVAALTLRHLQPAGMTRDLDVAAEVH